MVGGRDVRSSRLAEYCLVVEIQHALRHDCRNIHRCRRVRGGRSVVVLAAVIENSSSLQG